jgi:hypothetical protein
MAKKRAKKKGAVKAIKRAVRKAVHRGVSVQRIEQAVKQAMVKFAKRKGPAKKSVRDLETDLTERNFKVDKASKNRRIGSD